MIPGSCSLLTFDSITFLKHSSKMQNCIYTEYGDTLTPYHTCSIIRKGFCHNLMCLKITEQLTNSVDPYQTLHSAVHSAVSDIGLHCLLRLVCPNTSGYVLGQTYLSNRCTSRSVATECDIWSGSTLFTAHPAVLLTQYKI